MIPKELIELLTKDELLYDLNELKAQRHAVVRKYEQKLEDLKYWYAVQKKEMISKKQKEMGENMNAMTRIMSELHKRDGVYKREYARLKANQSEP